jgi:cell division protein FtsB
MQSSGVELGNSRWLIVLLVLAVIAMQGQLWLSEDGYRKTRSLRQAVVLQRGQNDELLSRNAALEAEVINLKQGHDAAEERARTDLGMIGPSETFYQVVPREAT